MGLAHPEMSLSGCSRVRRSWLRRAALFVTLLIVGSELVAAAVPRKIRFDRLSRRDGLAHSTVAAISQDHSGFIWLGTQDGLNRYDGYTFVTFKKVAGDDTSLPNSSILEIFEDSRRTLWIGTEDGGLARMNADGRTFTSYQNDPSDPTSLAGNRIHSIVEDNEGFLWIGTANAGLSRFDLTTETFSRFSHNPSNPNSLSSDLVRSLVVDSKGNLWAATDGGLNRFRPETNDFATYRNDPADPESLPEDKLYSVFEDRQGAIWVGTADSGLGRLDPETGRFTNFRHDPDDPGSLSQNRARVIFQDSTGTLWIGTDEGLSAWQPETSSFVHFNSDPTDQRSLSSNRVRAIYQDRGGVVWIGTTGGVDRWNPLTGSFPHYQADPNAESTLSSNDIQSFLKDANGELWVGTLGGGLNRFSPDRNTITHYRSDINDPTSLSDNRVMALLTDSRDELWAGTISGGLNRLVDRERGTFKRYLHDPSDQTTLSAPGVTSLLEDRDGALWVGTFGGGLNRFDTETGRFFHYRHDPDNPTSLSHDRVMALHQSRDGILWVGTEVGGLNRFDPETGTFSNFRHRPDDPTSLSGDTVLCVLEDRAGRLWIATREAGLNRWELEDRAAYRGVFKHYTQADGLPNDFVYGILEDDEGKLWLSTNDGLARFDPETESFKTYDETHDLQSNEFNVGAYHRAADGEMFFGGPNGFNAFYPGEVVNNLHVPPVVLTGFLKANRRVEFETRVSEVRSIEIDHNDSVVTFEFASLDYTAPESNLYTYKLENFDRDWIDLRDVRRATYTNLDPGAYVFRVRGSNNDGVWNQDGLAIDVTAIPPPWRTWWAYLGYLFALASLIAYFVRSQRRELVRAAENRLRLEEDVRRRTKELAERNAQLQLANKKLEEASLTDALTGLRNRRYLAHYIERDIALIRRYFNDANVGPGTVRPELLFLIIDLDGFKEINDTYGHAAGDQVLLQFREILESASRDADTLIRWGGDEFVVVGRELQPGTVEGLAERIRSSVRSAEFELGEDLPSARLSCSIGFAKYPFVHSAPELLSWEQVLTVADRALYAAKMSGRNAWVGIMGTSEAPPEDLLEKINEEPERLLRERVIRLHSSLGNPQDIRWDWR